MKKRLLKTTALVLIAIAIRGNANAQIYSSEDCFYAPAGSSSVSYVVKFEYSHDRVWIKSVSHGTVRQNLAKSKNFYENEVWTDGSGSNHADMYEYERSMSTSQREVYKRVEKIAIRSEECANLRGYGRTDVCEFFGSPWGGPRGCGRHGYTDGDTYYVAFAKDKSSYIRWRVSKNDVDKEVRDKKNLYSRSQGGLAA